MTSRLRMVLPAAALLVAAGVSPGVAVAGPAQLVNPTGVAGAQPPDPGPQATPGEMTADRVLDALDQRGQNLKSFDARVSMSDKDADLGLDSVRTGHVWFQKQGDAERPAARLFDQKSDGSKVSNEKIEYLLDKGWLVDRDYQKRVEVRRQVLRPGEKVNLLKLGEGPFPLPIGQKKEDVKKLFTVTKIKSAKDDPPGTVHLLLKPIKGTQFDRKFSAIDVWMDLKTQMPTQIDTLDKKEVVTRSTKLTDVVVNPDLGEKDFALPNIPDEGWNRHEEPFKE